MKARHALLLGAALCATRLFGQLVAVGANTGVTTNFYAKVVGQDLYITVDNSIATDSGITGTVTSFGFNTPWVAPLSLSKIQISYTVESDTGPTQAWKKFSSYTLNAGGYGGGLTVDLGIASDSNPNPNGNNPNNGVEFGEVVTFKFSFNATTYDIPELENIADFFNQSVNGKDFLVRWQDIEYPSSNAKNGGCGGCGDCQGATSDTFAGTFTVEEFHEVPEPSTYGLLGAFMLAAAIGIRRFRPKAA